MLTSKLSKKLAASLIAFLFFCVLQIIAQNNKYDEPISEEHYEILEKRKQLIEQENSSSKNEWSGVYSLGDHHPTIFMWSENQGFLTWGSHHTFSPSRINFGKAEFSNNRLTIKPEVSEKHLNFQFIPSELIAVKWDKQHFLISADKLMNFAYAVHSGAESQIVSFFAKSKDYQESRKGLPNLPKEYEPILTMKAIRPKIVAVERKGDFYERKITLNLGRASKLVEGMIFYYGSSSGSMQIMITDLQENTSKAKLVGIAGTGKNLTPRVGLKFTSKIPAGAFDL